MRTWRNVGSLDRIIRGVVCVAMFVAGWANLIPQPWSAALQIFAVPGMLTTILGWDPVYALLGVSTFRPSRRG
jgi:hypothetical protein